MRTDGGWCDGLTEGDVTDDGLTEGDVTDDGLTEGDVGLAD